jgi:hypothetical protein
LLHNKIVLLGDREFCSVSLANCLRKKNLAFSLRLKKNENIEIENGIWCQLNHLGLKPGISIFIKDFKVTKTKQISGFNIAGKWKRRACKNVAKEGWFILTTRHLSNRDLAPLAQDTLLSIAKTCARLGFLLLAMLIMATMLQSTTAQSAYQITRSFPVIATGIESIQNTSRLACISTAKNKLSVCLYTHTINILKGGRKEKSSKVIY